MNVDKERVTISRGGRHSVECDGTRHVVIMYDGRRRDDGRCDCSERVVNGNNANRYEQKTTLKQEADRYTRMMRGTL